MTTTGGVTPSPTLALAAGGTGGHMFPAQALAQEACRRGWRVVLLTDDRGLRYATSFPADDVIVLDAANPNVSGVLSKASMAAAMARGVLTARRGLKRHAPGVVVGFGGYPSAPGLAAARSLGIPFGVHEQNAVLGRVNRLAAPRAAFVAHGFPRLDRVPSGSADLIYLGNPVRDAVREISGAPYVSPTSSTKTRVLIFGGSQGARLFGKVFPAVFERLPADLRANVLITHQVAEDDIASVKRAYLEAGIDAELAPFFTDLPKRMADSHFVIARAGASTVTELATIGRPSLLVPLAIAMDDHQFANAEVLGAVGAATVVREADLTPEHVAALLSPLLADSKGLARAAASAGQLVPDDAAKTLADRLEPFFAATADAA